MLRAEPAPRILTVTQLAALVRAALEGGVGSVWVAGEISNLRRAPSGHVYFTLKDEESQLDAVLFRSAAQALAFRPADGMEVLVYGRVSLYPARGALQLYVDRMEPRGLGALQLAFEQLKARLGAEGLFAAARKRPLPRFPRAVGVVTALGGAVIHDMRTVLRQRWPACGSRSPSPAWPTCPGPSGGGSSRAACASGSGSAGRSPWGWGAGGSRSSPRSRGPPSTR